MKIYKVNHKNIDISQWIELSVYISANKLSHTSKNTSNLFNINIFLINANLRTEIYETKNLDKIVNSYFLELKQKYQTMFSIIKDNSTSEEYNKLLEIIHNILTKGIIEIADNVNL